MNQMNQPTSTSRSIKIRLVAALLALAAGVAAAIVAILAVHTVLG